MVFTVMAVKGIAIVEQWYSHSPLRLSCNALCPLRLSCNAMCPLRPRHAPACPIRTRICGQNLPQDFRLGLTPRIPIPSSKSRSNLYRDSMTRKMLLMVRTGNNTILHFSTLFHTISFIVISAGAV